ncbi:MAG: TIGR04255 family protein [Cytophagales bacterium]|nr:TIGR04255 family protein [Cytophagales bacterium]
MRKSTKTTIKTYKYPPITEAVIEIRTGGMTSIDDLKKTSDKIMQDKHYYKLNLINDLGVNIEKNSKTKDFKINAQEKFADYRITSEDETDIVILSQQKLVVARLAPYPGWDNFYKRFVSIKKIWKRFVGQEAITRIGVRFINRIDIPFGEAKQIEIEDYLNFYPKDAIFSEIPMMDYLIRIEKKTPSPLWSTTITSTPHPPALVKTISLLLDIDIFRTSEIPLREEEFNLVLEEAHILKNKIFEDCITDKTRSLLTDGTSG